VTEPRDLEALAARAEAEIARAASREALEQLRVAYLGRRSDLQAAFKEIAAMPAGERKAAGARLNLIKQRIEAAVAARGAELSAGAGAAALDVTFPGRPVRPGSRHPLPATIDEICGIFRAMGFETAEGPEVETEHNNFDALNTPPDHPARDMQDTFYLKPGLLLRTQTSAIWARVMKRRDPPLRIVCPGRTFRRDAVDATHSPVFHQVEGLWIDENCSFADLRGVLAAFFTEFFGREMKVRFEPRYFPFTEPSTEVAIECTSCRGSGCPACARSGWLEVLGAGMVHPNILANAGRGYAKPGVRGFAFGLGVERMAMLKHRIADMRWFYENDLRVLGQVRG